MTPQQLRDQIEDNELEFHRALNTLKYCKMTRATNAKRRLYTDNILLNSGSLLEQWVLRTYINVENMRLQFLESDQKKRVASEEEIVASREKEGNRIDPTVGGCTCLIMPSIHLHIGNKAPGCAGNGLKKKSTITVHHNHNVTLERRDDASGTRNGS